MKALFWISLLALPCLTTAQSAPSALPETDIYLAELTTGTDGTLTFGALQNVTARPGYENQPAFLPDGGAFVYAAQMPDGQTDVFRYDLATRKHVLLTQTPESEYSPTPVEDGFSTVRVERDGSQRLWKFSPDGKNFMPVLAGIGAVGYHAWVDATHVALFLVGDEAKGEPHRLVLADTTTGETRLLASNIGRCLLPVPGRRAVAYVHKAAENAWSLRRYDLATGNDEVLVPTPAGSEDFTFLADGRVLMGKGSALYIWNGRIGDGFMAVHDFGAALGGDIGRLAVSPDGRWLALVVTPKEPAKRGIRG